MKTRGSWQLVKNWLCGLGHLCTASRIPWGEANFLSKLKSMMRLGCLEELEEGGAHETRLAVELGDRNTYTGLIYYSLFFSINMYTSNFKTLNCLNKIKIKPITVIKPTQAATLQTHLLFSSHFFPVPWPHFRPFQKVLCVFSLILS